MMTITKRAYTDHVRFSTLGLLRLKFIVWSEWGDERHQKWDDMYFSFYDLFCCSMVLFPMSFCSALFVHLVQAGAYA